MFNALPYKTKQFFFVLIKLSIVVGAFYFIYKKLAENEGLEFSVFMRFLTENKVFSVKNIFFLFILSIFNWFFEILKWRYLVASFKKLSFVEALEQSLGSLTASLVTPNRIGEYGAKAVYFSKVFRKRVLLLNLWGNMNQMATTCLFGIIGLFFLFNNYPIDIDYYRVSRIFVIIAAVSLFTLFGLRQDKFRIRGFTITRVKEFLVSIPTKTKLLTFTLSVIRYLIFSYQFYVLLGIFGVDVTYPRAMVVISSMYLLSSLIPTVFIFDVVIKGSVAVYLFSIVGVNEITVLCIILLMWIINVVIPSIFGSYYVLNFNLYSNANE